MAVATKAAAFAIFLRLFDEALRLAQLEWAPALAALAAITIVVGNVGRDRAALAQADAGLVGRGAGGLHAGRRGGGHASSALQATAFYLAVYLVMNVAAFAVVIARERVSEHGDDLALARGPRPRRSRGWPGR